MPDINIRIQNKKAAIGKGTNDEIVCCNSDYNLVFVFDDEWSAHEWKRVRLISDGYHGRIVDTQVGPANTCPLPPVHKASYIDVGVYVDDEIRTTTPVRLTCIPSILCE